MLNKVILMGRLVAAPEIHQTNSGVMLARFRIAVDRDFKDKNGNRQADFISCTAWRGTAEFLQKYFFKGSLIALTGSLTVNQYEKDGQKRSSTDVTVDQVYFAGEKPKPQMLEQQDQQDNFQPIYDDGPLPWDDELPM